MFTSTPQHEVDFAVEADAHRLLTSLYQDRVADHLLDGQEAPTPQQVTLTLRALADFPLCMRVLPLAGYRRLGDEVTGVSTYLWGFAEHLARFDVRIPYDPRYWILDAPVTDRLVRKVAALAGTAPSDLPSVRQSAATLLALADPGAMELPRRMVEIAGDGDLPWNGATGIGRWLLRLAESIAPHGGTAAGEAQNS